MHSGNVKTPFGLPLPFQVKTLKNQNKQQAEAELPPPGEAREREPPSPHGPRTQVSSPGSLARGDVGPGDVGGHRSKHVPHSRRAHCGSPSNTSAGSAGREFRWPSRKRALAVSRLERVPCSHRLCRAPGRRDGVGQRTARGGPPRDRTEHEWSRHRTSSPAASG